jgi:putative hydrolase of the HAD superfamily
MEGQATRNSGLIQAVFFDLDGTLYDRDAAVLQTAHSQFEAFRWDLGNVTQSVFVERLVALDAHGHNRTPRLHHVLAEELGFSSMVADGLETHFRSNFPKSCRLSPDTLATLKTLRTRGLKVGMITNGPTYWQTLKIESMGIAPLFDAILISGSEGIEKPDPRIFARAVERCGVTASESMFVGDHPEADILGAKAAGLVPIWKRMAYWSVPDEVQRIERISEILPLIG